MARLLTASEVAKHNTAESCWVILYNQVYDVTDFLSSHPGGSKIILKLAGKDATEEYNPVHPPGTLEENLKSEAKLGAVDPASLAQSESPASKDTTDEGLAEQPLENLLNLDEIEDVATKKISKKAWAYYFSAGDDLISKRLNNEAYRSILLRPRIFIDCEKFLQDETLTAMRLLGVRSVSELGPKHINSRAVEQQIYDGPAGFEKVSLWVQSKL